MKNYIKRVLFAIGMIVRNIVKLVFATIGMVFFFTFNLITFLLVIFGWYNNIDGRKINWQDFNPITSINFFNQFFN